MRFISRSRSGQVDEIKTLAAEFDPQPLHLEEQAAAGSMFGGLVASGWHSAAVSMRLLVDSSPIAGEIVGSEVQLEWLQPVRPGMTSAWRPRSWKCVPPKADPTEAVPSHAARRSTKRVKLCWRSPRR